MADCWDLLSRIVGEPEQATSTAVALPEAVYERTYREAPEALSRKFLSGAKQFLEKQLRLGPSFFSRFAARLAHQLTFSLLHSFVAAIGTNE